MSLHHGPPSLATWLDLTLRRDGSSLDEVMRSLWAHSGGGPIAEADIAAGDEILAVSGWRLRRLDDAQRLLTPGRPADLLVARDQRVLALQLVLPTDASLGAPVQLAADAKPGKSAQALREAWLGR